MLDKLFDRLFPPKTPVAVHQLLRRSEKETEDYEDWLSAKTYNRMVEYVASEIKSNAAQADVLNFSQTATNGIVIYFGEWTTERDFRHFLFYMAYKISTLGYIQVHADKYMKEQGAEVESKARIYLKSRSRKSPVDQLYGNILLELVRNNNISSYIKLQANTYSDRNFLDPKPFEELLDHLLQIDER